MASLNEYIDKYPSIRMERQNGILQMTFHTDDGPLQWGGSPHKEFSQVFVDVGSDQFADGPGSEDCGCVPRPDIAVG